MSLTFNWSFPKALPKGVQKANEIANERLSVQKVERLAKQPKKLEKRSRMTLEQSLMLASMKQVETKMEPTAPKRELVAPKFRQHGEYTKYVFRSPKDVATWTRKSGTRASVGSLPHTFR